MDLRDGEQEIYNGHPSWRATLGFYILGVVAVAIIAFVTKLATDTGTGVLVGIVLLALMLAVGWLRRMTTRYTITTQRLYVRRGIIARHIDQTRIERVQDVSTNESVLERVLRIGNVDFDTAGGDHREDMFQFRGVSNPDEIVAKVDEAVHAVQGAHVQPAAQQPGATQPPPPPRQTDGL